MAKSVEAIPSSYFSESEVMALLSKHLPSNMQDLPVTRNFVKLGIVKSVMQVVQVQRLVLNEVVRRVISYTPRNTGHLRYNWQVQVGGTNNNELFVSGGSYSDKEALSKAFANITKMKLNQTVNLFNNASYAKKAESTGWKGSNGGYHPPYGMLKRVISEFNDIVNSVVAQVKAGN